MTTTNTKFTVSIFGPSSKVYAVVNSTDGHRWHGIPDGTYALSNQTFPCGNDALKAVQARLLELDIPADAPVAIFDMRGNSHGGILDVAYTTVGCMGSYVDLGWVPLSPGAVFHDLPKEEV